MTTIRTVKRGGPLSRDAQQLFDHQRKQITKKRRNRVGDETEATIRKMHAKDIATGRANKPGESFQYYPDTCIADGCINRKLRRGQPESTDCFNKRCKHKSLFKL